MPSKPPSLLSAFLSDKAPGYAKDVTRASDEPIDNADDTAPRPGVAAAQSILDALDDNDPEALADAFGAVLDLHESGDEPKPPADDKPSPKPALVHVHIHTS